MSNTVCKILLILGLASGAAQAMQDTYSWSLEQHLTENIDGIISAQFNQGQQAVFHRDGGPDIHYYLYVDNPKQPCIVISPGRGEGYLKYQEVIYDVINNGYNVAVIDHRGQGLSDREQTQRHRGYVQSFDHYVEDLHQIIQAEISPRCQGPLFLLGHSMGGTIATLYVQKYPERIKALALSAPMFGIDSGNIPNWLASSMVAFGNRINSLFSDQAWYFFGHGPYQEKPFTDNDLTHSEIRYSIFRKTWEQHPKVQLGGVTFAWLNAAIAAMEKILVQIEQHKTPTLVLQAEKDSVVDNPAQTVFCQRLKLQSSIECETQTPVVIAGARHEILFESDQIRQAALTMILDFFSAQDRSD